MWKRSEGYATRQLSNASFVLPACCRRHDNTRAKRENRSRTSGDPRMTGLVVVRVCSELTTRATLTSLPGRPSWRRDCLPRVSPCAPWGTVRHSRESRPPGPLPPRGSRSWSRYCWENCSTLDIFDLTCRAGIGRARSYCRDAVAPCGDVREPSHTTTETASATVRPQSCQARTNIAGVGRAPRPE